MNKTTKKSAEHSSRRWRNRAVIGGLAFGMVLALSACGSTAAPSTTTTHPPTTVTTSQPTTSTQVSGPAEVGGSLAAWKRAYPADGPGPGVMCSAANSCFGPSVTNSESGSTYQFVDASVDDGIVDGFQENFPDNSTLNDVETALYQVMPPDTKIVYFHVIQSSANGSCAILNMHSATLARVLADPKIGDPQGVVGVVLVNTDSNDNGFYSATNVGDATVGVAPMSAADGC